jgi:hypothetical protein
MAGMGRYFMDQGRKQDFDGRLLVALAYAETEAGKYVPSQAKKNAYGWGAAGGKNPGGFKFASWEQNVKAVARGLREIYFDKGLDTIPEIASKWLGRNDPEALWTKNVTWVYEHLGGGYPIEQK